MTSVTHLSARRRVAALTAAAVALGPLDRRASHPGDTPPTRRFNWPATTRTTGHRGCSTDRSMPSSESATRSTSAVTSPRSRHPTTAAPVLNRPYLFAFNATTGAILDSFAAVPSGPVKVLLPDGDGRVYVGGQFTKMNGVTSSHVALVDGTTGARINAFKPSKTNSAVFDLRLRGPASHRRWFVLDSRQRHASWSRQSRRDNRNRQRLPDRPGIGNRLGQGQSPRSARSTSPQPETAWWRWETSTPSTDRPGFRSRCST